MKGADAYQVSSSATVVDYVQLTNDTSQHSIDIEMTVTDGKLDVGLFCPESMVSLERAEEALTEFKALLEKVVGKAKE
jgi:hypothetical protein